MKSFLFALLLTGAVFPLLSFGYDGPTEYLVEEPPSSPGKVSKFVTYYVCAGIYTGTTYTCPFSHYVTGVKLPDTVIFNNGGHFAPHAPRFLSKDRLPLTTTAEDTDSSDYGVKGFTKSIFFIGVNWITVTHPVPENSGSIVGNSSVNVIYEFNDTYDVIYRGLTREKLPKIGVDHIVARGDTNEHPQGTHGKQAVIDQLLQIAKDYHDFTGRKLSINDISLPDGGLFDVAFTYTNVEGHSSHRTGEDVDINPTDGGGIRKGCYRADVLWALVEAASSDTYNSRLYCENDSGGFDTDPRDPTFIKHHIQFRR